MLLSQSEIIENQKEEIEKYIKILEIYDEWELYKFAKTKFKIHTNEKEIKLDIYIKKAENELYEYLKEKTFYYLNFNESNIIIEKLNDGIKFLLFINDEIESFDDIYNFEIKYDFNKLNQVMLFEFMLIKYHQLHEYKLIQQLFEKMLK